MTHIDTERPYDIDIPEMSEGFMLQAMIIKVMYEKSTDPPIFHSVEESNIPELSLNSVWIVMESADGARDPRRNIKF